MLFPLLRRWSLGRRTVTEALVRRAERAGYQALVVTVDNNRVGFRETEKRLGVSLPPGLSLGNFEHPSTRGVLGSGDAAGGREALPAHATLKQRVNAQYDDSLTWDSVRWISVSMGRTRVGQGLRLRLPWLT